MFAVLQSGGKQHRVTDGDLLRVERLAHPEKAQVLLDRVVMLGEGEQVTLGKPFIEGAGVAVEVLQHGRGKKIIVFKRKRRQNYRRTHGHRQDYTLLRVLEVLSDASQFKPQESRAASAESKIASQKTTAKKVTAKKVTAKKVTAKTTNSQKPIQAKKT